ncbi:MAG TPA: heme biosynthesis HemY N-terminal domain-containing protein [Stellaceae bacterium]|nr:heme biosynthesis HemY N-terminal domain-containing protein [Stellaceae bacterium]
MRTILALILIVLVSAAALFFTDHPGTVTLIWQGWRVDTSVAVLAAATALIALILWLGFATLAWLIAAPRRLARRRREGRRLQGYRALTDGLVAIAAGDTRSAERLRLRAERHFQASRLDVPPLTRLLAAQAALLRGDHPEAHSQFTRMLDSPETEFLGLRGLIVQALKAGDDATALKLTQRANELRPATAWVLQSQLALETRAHDWRGAKRTLDAAIRRKAVTPEQGARHHVALLLARAAEASHEGRSGEALRAAATAHGLDAAFAPAAAAYAALLGDQGRAGRALKVIEAAWSRSGHPALAQLYDRLLDAETPTIRLKRFERLVELRAGDPESHLAAAAVALSARLWGEARRHLDAAGAAGPGPWPQRLCRLMAELEDGEHQDAAAARRWLERAHQSPPDPVWVCDVCGAEAARWEPLCPNCHSFDTLGWRVPDRAAPRVVAEPGRRSPAEAAAMLELSHALVLTAGPSAAAAGKAAESATRESGA